MTSAFTFDQTYFTFWVDSMSLGDHFLTMFVTDNNSCGAASGPLQPFQYFTVTKIYQNSAPTWVDIIPTQTLCILEGNRDIQLSNSMFSDLDVTDSHSWTQTNGCLFGVNISPSLVLTISDASSYSNDGYSCGVNLYVEDDDSYNGGVNPLQIVQSFSVYFNSCNYGPILDFFTSAYTLEVFEVFAFDIASFTDANSGDTHTISVICTPVAAFISFDSFTN